MKTYRISEEEIKGLKPIAVGYKVFNNDWTSKSGKYDYKDENGNVVGTIHKVEGDISECKWGLHFSKNPQDCFYFYECIQWNKFAKVVAYDKVIDCGEKSVTNILKIVETYTFEEFIKLKKELLKSSKGVSFSNGVNYSFGVAWSYGVNYSNGVNDSNGVSFSKGVDEAYGVNRSYAVNDSNGVNYSFGVNDSNGVNKSKGVNWSDCVAWSHGVNSSYGVYDSYGVNKSEGINDSNGVSWSYGILQCEGISKAIFCYKKSGKLMAFNKKISEERFNEIYLKIKEYNWYPRFNNAEELKGGLEWYETNIPAIVKVDNKTAWSKMPKDMLEYIKSLPEYNEKIFNKIIGDIEK